MTNISDQIPTSPVRTLTEAEWRTPPLPSYRSNIEGWLAWASDSEYPAAPAEPAHIIAFIAGRAQAGTNPSTLNKDLLAISAYHRALGLDDPISHQVRVAESNVRRRHGSPATRIPALTIDRFEVIKQTISSTRSGMETVATIALARDGLLRSHDLCGLRWADVEDSADGTGILTFVTTRRMLAKCPLCAETMEFLSAIRGGDDDDDRILNVTPKTNYCRIRRAAVAAGLGDGYTTDSPRLGMASDLLNAGESLLNVMLAARMTDPRFIEFHLAEELAERAAMARLDRMNAFIANHR